MGKADKTIKVLEIIKKEFEGRDFPFDTYSSGALERELYYCKEEIYKAIIDDLDNAIHTLNKKEA